MPADYLRFKYLGFDPWNPSLLCFSSCLPWFLKAAGECFQGDTLSSLICIYQLFNWDCGDSSTLKQDLFVFPRDSLDFPSISFGLRSCLQELLSPSLSQIVCLPSLWEFLCLPGEQGACQRVLVLRGSVYKPEMLLVTVPVLESSQCWEKLPPKRLVQWLRLLLPFFPMGNRFSSFYSNGS